MPWLTSLDELRSLLHDGPTDKLRSRKRVFGECNGTNTSFKTLEYRRVNDFTAVGTVYPLGVWKNGIILTPADVTTDFPDTGDFQLALAPVDGDYVEASYYIQYFTDAELVQFIENATKWLSFTDPLTLSVCLQQAALKYAAHEAYQKLALRFIEMLSETYRLEDQPKPDREALINSFTSLSDSFLEEAKKVRDDCYSRSGKQLEPSWGFSQGRVTDPQPKR